MKWNWEDCPDVESVPGRCGGQPVFAGSRLPVSALVEHLEQQGTVDEFLEWFEGVDRAAVERVAGRIRSELLASR